MLFFKNSIENEPIPSRRYDCPESMLFFKNSIENEPILSCPESMLFFKNSIENEPILSRRYDCPEPMFSEAGRLAERESYRDRGQLTSCLRSCEVWSISTYLSFK